MLSSFQKELAARTRTPAEPEALAGRGGRGEKGERGEEGGWGSGGGREDFVAATPLLKSSGHDYIFNYVFWPICDYNYINCMPNWLTAHV